MREAVAERDLLRRLAPHLVEPVPFVVPVTGRRARARLGAGLWAYDALSAFKALHIHRRVRADETIRLFPALRGAPRGGYLYYDCKTDDVRLVMEVLVGAVRHGAVVCNHAEVTYIEPGFGVTTVGVRDRVRGDDLEIRARKVIVAAGVWADRIESLMKPHARPRLRPSKGVHLVFDQSDLPVSDAAALIPDVDRRRMLFVIPWQGCVLVGTTDTPHSGDLDSASVDASDYAYCLDAVNASFDLDLTTAQVVGAFAGLRPLVAGQGGTTADLSRRHLVYELAPGVVGITGGKLTTWRRMAADALDTAIRGMGPGPRSRTRRLRLGCGRLDVLTATATGRAERLRLDPGLAPALVRRYGDRALAVLDLVEETGLATPIADEPTHVAAEALYAIRAEMAIDLEDFMARRIRLALTDRDGGADRAVSSLFGTERGWSAKETRAQESRYLKSLERERPVADRAGA